MTEQTLLTPPQITHQLANIKQAVTKNSVENLRVIRRTGAVISYNENKIVSALSKAFLAVEGPRQEASCYQELVAALSQQITATFLRRANENNLIHIEEIQDQVELSLMRAGEHKVARTYVIYREEHRKQREQQVVPATSLSITLPDSSKQAFDEAHFKTLLIEVCQDHPATDPDLLLTAITNNLYETIPLTEIYQLVINYARSLIYKEPNYEFVATKLLLNSLYSDALAFLGLGNHVSLNEITNLYPVYFRTYLNKGIKLGLLAPELLNFDLDKITNALTPEKDLNFSQLGLYTLHQTYLLAHEKFCFELPQAFFMRIAMGLALTEADKESAAINFYQMLSSFDFMPGEPLLHFAGKLNPQLMSGYTITVADNLESLINTIKDNALIAKQTSDLMNDWTLVRAQGTTIKSFPAKKAKGFLPYAKIAHATLQAVLDESSSVNNQMATLEIWHLEIEVFLETQQSLEKAVLLPMANWIPDLFMERVLADAEWTLFSPDEVPDLHEYYGKDFKKAYLAYENKAARNKIKYFKKISAQDLWQKMLAAQLCSHHHYFAFKDACNIRSTQTQLGTIHCTNSAGLTFTANETDLAACPIGAINLANHINQQTLDTKKLQRTISLAVRLLDNAIDIHAYEFPSLQNFCLKHRSIGLGIMGFQESLYKLNIPYATTLAAELADKTIETFSYFAIQASHLLAQERGSYDSFEGSTWSQGILPLTSLETLAESRSGYLEQNKESSIDWPLLAKQMMTGMRNANLLAIGSEKAAASLCNLCPALEPRVTNLTEQVDSFTDFAVFNQALVHTLKATNLWNNDVLNALKYHHGNLKEITQIPEQIKTLFATSFEIEQATIIEIASRSQKWLDQAVVFHVYLKEASLKKLDILYRLAWSKGIKAIGNLLTKN